MGRHRKMKDFPKPVRRLTKTSLPQNDFHRFPWFGKIVGYFELLFTALNANSVIAAGVTASITMVPRHSSNHGAQKNSHMQEPIRTYYRKSW